ncbi:MAG TPA: HAD hydrolase family protein [Actinomycetes bacterium]|jgi:hydroxymethylpyrimidine pyrophosphatase-like HAD family hydrolase|nr:HAD hydrolase family protein [Actinomycetes bacterium]
MVAVALGEAGQALGALEVAVLFSDVDGTLVGRGGSLLADLDGEPSLAAAEALLLARRAGLQIVLVSGRTRAQLFETGRLLGLRDAIAEMGAVLVRDGRAELQWGEAPRDAGPTPAAALERSGAVRALLDTFSGRIEPHAPWHENRQGTALLRGQVEVAEVDAALRDQGLGWTRLLDNGRLRGPYPHLGPGQTHAYHLLPAGVSKAATAAAYLTARGLEPSRAAAVGDGPADLELADAVGTMFLVANGAWAAAEAGERRAVVTPSSAGRGFAEVVSVLCPATRQER